VDNVKDHITKYLKGELSPAEMHDLEMKALQDPFLADALEGAEKISPDKFSSDVDEINKKLIKGSTNKLYWPLRIAASILLILSVTYFFLTSNPENEQMSLVVSDSSAVAESDLPLQKDSIYENKVDEKLLSLKTEEKTSESNQAKPETNPIASTPSSQVDKIEVADQASEDDDFIADAEITQEAGPTDELLLAEEKLDKVQEEKAMVQSEVLRKEAAPVAQSSAGAERAKKQAYAETSTAASNSMSHEEYQLYLRNNVIYPQAAIDNSITGEVIVSFIVKANGELSDFVTEKGIGFGCEEELIRLIKEGPKWTPATVNDKPIREKVTLSFTFERR